MPFLHSCPLSRSPSRNSTRTTAASPRSSLPEACPSCAQSYFEHEESKFNLANAIAIALKVKLADRKDNMDITRLETLDPKDIERLQKYHGHYWELVASYGVM